MQVATTTALPPPSKNASCSSSNSPPDPPKCRAVVKGLGSITSTPSRASSSRSAFTRLLFYYSSSGPRPSHSASPAQICVPDRLLKKRTRGNSVVLAALPTKSDYHRPQKADGAPSSSSLSPTNGRVLTPPLSPSSLPSRPLPSKQIIRAPPQNTDKEVTTHHQQETPLTAARISLRARLTRRLRSTNAAPSNSNNSDKASPDFPEPSHCQSSVTITRQPLRIKQKCVQIPILPASRQPVRLIFLDLDNTLIPTSWIMHRWRSMLHRTPLDAAKEIRERLEQSQLFPALDKFFTVLKSAGREIPKDVENDENKDQKEAKTRSGSDIARVAAAEGEGTACDTAIVIVTNAASRTVTSFYLEHVMPELQKLCTKHHIEIKSTEKWGAKAGIAPMPHEEHDYREYYTQIKVFQFEEEMKKFVESHNKIPNENSGLSDSAGDRVTESDEFGIKRGKDREIRYISFAKKFTAKSTSPAPLMPSSFFGSAASQDDSSSDVITPTTTTATTAATLTDDDDDDDKRAGNPTCDDRLKSSSEASNIEVVSIGDQLCEISAAIRVGLQYKEQVDLIKVLLILDPAIDQDLQLKQYSSGEASPKDSSSSAETEYQPMPHEGAIYPPEFFVARLQQITEVTEKLLRDKGVTTELRKTSNGDEKVTGINDDNGSSSSSSSGCDDRNCSNKQRRAVWTRSAETKSLAYCIATPYHYEGKETPSHQSKQKCRHNDDGKREGVSSRKERRRQYQRKSTVSTVATINDEKCEQQPNSSLPPSPPPFITRSNKHKRTACKYTTGEYTVTETGAVKSTDDATA